MTGPEHYKAAEQLLTDAVDRQDSRSPQTVMLVSRAQVHATLAHAAATAMAALNEHGMHHADFNAWDDVCGTRP